MSTRVSFGEFAADLTTGQLWRNGISVPLQDLPFRLLATLVERPGELVTRTELSGRLWGSETYVDATAGLNTAVAKLREALGDDPDAPRYIETIPKRGYRFIGAISKPVPPHVTAEPLSPIRAERRRWPVVAFISKSRLHFAQSGCCAEAKRQPEYYSRARSRQRADA